MFDVVCLICDLDLWAREVFFAVERIINTKKLKEEKNSKFFSLFLPVASFPPMCTPSTGKGVCQKGKRGKLSERKRSRNQVFFF
jgi:hypothetical protein